ncbi:EAL and HDOD domain-containing protein [Oceanobacter mangrovi]|uniref:EAL and HDOD domain-containing protein n=1 Tax=Oceanobacter mangrovi TaxID=2862510 RepID=UPI001C8D8262|nr:HDOD domain-containing protein [Oceanobacter mangrovi]
MTNFSAPLLARQPILNKNQEIVGYELLSRPVPAATEAWQASHGDSATSEVITGAFGDLGIEEVTGGLPAFINFTRFWLENPPMICGQQVVAEILEHLELTTDLIPHLQKLKKLQFRVALDDYTGAVIPPELLDHIDIIKVDILALDNPQKMTDLIQQYQRPGLSWLAEKVETQEDFEACLAAGFELFQGYFFARPHTLYGKKISDNKLSVLKLLRVLNNPDSEVDDVTRVIQADPQLSFRLLQIVNSASMGCPTEVTSINRAIMIIGFDRLRSWSNLLALGQLNDKPRALQEQAVARACLARQLAAHWKNTDKETAFTIGLLSLLDAFVDLPMPLLCQKLKLPDAFTKALTERSGELGALLKVILKLEQADWSTLNWAALEQRGLSSQDVSLAYLEALTDARDLIQALS